MRSVSAEFRCTCASLPILRPEITGPGRAPACKRVFRSPFPGWEGCRCDDDIGPVSVTGAIEAECSLPIRASDVNHVSYSCRLYVSSYAKQLWFFWAMAPPLARAIDVADWTAFVIIDGWICARSALARTRRARARRGSADHHDRQHLAKLHRRNGRREAPAGLLEPDETFEQGVVGGICEETGVTAVVDDLGGVYKNTTVGVVVEIVYRCRFVSGAPTATAQSQRAEQLMASEVEERMMPAYAVRALDMLTTERRSRVHDGPIAHPALPALTAPSGGHSAPCV